MANITIKDIARLAGVSIRTVSRCIEKITDKDYKTESIVISPGFFVGKSCENLLES